jgi:hypothetical protein
MISTAGMVRALTSTLIWEDWDVSTDAIEEILFASGFQINDIQEYDRSLHMEIAITKDSRIKYFVFVNPNISIYF